MKIHHLNCGSLREIDPADGPGSPLTPRRVVCHCLLIETAAAGLVLIDTGLGTRDIEHPGESLGADWVTLAEPALDPGETALRQVTLLDHSSADVRHIVVTHLDRDHAGGIPDFPHARVHVHQAEYQQAIAGSLRQYRQSQVGGHRNWATYLSGRDGTWFGFDAVQLDGLPPEILLIPLGGHSPGHSAVAVKAGDHWLLHAGDACFYHQETDPDVPRSHSVLDFVQLSAETDRSLRLSNVARLRELRRHHGDRVKVFCAHDPWEFQQMRAC